MITVEVRLDTKRLDKLRAGIKDRAETILQHYATDIQARAIVNTVRVDTGAMKNGWRVAQDKPLQRTIYNTQEYAIYHELGTVKMSASPMLAPAVEDVRASLEAAWAGLFEE